jgi:hypothetical protein
MSGVEIADLPVERRDFSVEPSQTSDHYNDLLRFRPGAIICIDMSVGNTAGAIDHECPGHREYPLPIGISFLEIKTGAFSTFLAASSISKVRPNCSATLPP